MEAKTILNILTKELGMNQKEKGKNFFFLCPFHDDKNPSLCFEKNAKFFKCFSCDFKAKDIFAFWSKYKKLTIEETFEELASLGYIKGKSLIAKKEEKSEEDYLLEIFELVTEIYQNNLLTEKGKKSFDYLKKKRLLTEDLIEKFKIGTTISNEQLSSLFLEEKNSYRISDITKTNLFQINDKEKPLDFFWENQIVIPIKNEKGKVVLFASRNTIEKGNENKYIFLSNNKLTQKSFLIYNYNFARGETTNFCYLVEGFFDVISLCRRGIKNCISLLGTSISKEQIILLKKLDKKVIIFLDGDKAGIEAAVKISTTLSLNEIDCEVIDNQSKMDPDDICKLESDEILKIIKRKMNPYFFVIMYYFNSLEIKENPQRIRRFILTIADIFRQFKFNIKLFIIEKISIVTKISLAETRDIYFSNNNKKELDVKELLW